MNRATQQRRKSQLGRRFLNGQKSERLTLGQLALPYVTPKSRTGLGRSRACATTKATNDNSAKKQLFSQSSSGKKTQSGSSLRAINYSPNDSQGSYQGDLSLNVTGVQSIKSLSPDNINSSANQFTMKPYDGYMSKIEIKTPISFDRQTTWDATNLKPPPSPPPSRYDRLIQLELASLKPPVDPDDLIDLKNLTFDQHLQSHSHKSYPKPITSTAIKEVNVSKFSPHLSSTCINSNFPSNSEKEKLPSSKLSSSVQTSLTVEIPETNEQICRTGLESCQEFNTVKSCNMYDSQNSNAESITKFESNNKTINNCKNGKMDQKKVDDEKNNYRNEDQLEPMKLGRQLDIFIAGHESSVKTDKKLQSIKEEEETKIIASKHNPVIRSLNFENFEFTKPLEMKQFQISTNALKVDKAISDASFFNEAPDSTPSRELKQSLNVTMTSNVEPSASGKNLFSINEISEELSNDSDDLNSTDSFLLQEQTIIDQDEHVTGLENKNKSSTNIILNNLTLNATNKETSDSDDELAQALIKVDLVINKAGNFRRQLKGLDNEMMVWENEMKSVKTTLKKLKDKRIKSTNRAVQNKENMPTTEKKQIRHKWFDEMKSENPNLLKTPNPARQSVSRMSLANQSIMTPHSLSIVVSDQIDNLFN